MSSIWENFNYFFEVFQALFHLPLIARRWARDEIVEILWIILRIEVFRNRTIFSLLTFLKLKLRHKNREIFSKPFFNILFRYHNLQSCLVHEKMWNKWSREYEHQILPRKPFNLVYSSLNAIIQWWIINELASLQTLETTKLTINSMAANKIV